jgi:FixJ family two-component response regulator
MLMEGTSADLPLIAIVDDDAMVAEALKDLIETLGFAAQAFTSGAAFLRSERLARAACLLADIQMPRMNGLQLLRRLRRCGSRIPVIFITAFPDKRIRNRALKAGAVCYLTKPFDGEELRACIEVALGQRGQSDA